MCLHFERIYMTTAYESITGALEAEPPEGMTTALYRHFDADGKPLYYGITASLRQRHDNHRSQSLWPKLAASSTLEGFTSRAEAHAAERAAIRADEPLFNRDHNTRGA